MKVFSPPIPHSPLAGYKAVVTAGGVEFSGCLFGLSKAGGRGKLHAKRDQRWRHPGEPFFALRFSIFDRLH